MLALPGIQNKYWLEGRISVVHLKRADSLSTLSPKHMISTPSNASHDIPRPVLSSSPYLLNHFLIDRPQDPYLLTYSILPPFTVRSRLGIVPPSQTTRLHQPLTSPVTARLRHPPRRARPRHVIARKPERRERNKQSCNISFDAILSSLALGWQR